jgi:hypothetical protein
MKTYRINFDGTYWHVNEQRFRTDAAAIGYVRNLEGAEGRLEKYSKDRIEIHFDKQR